MNSPHTFVGKVATLGVGMALSWGTVMHQDVAHIASALLGGETPTEVSASPALVRLSADERVRAVATETLNVVAEPPSAVGSDLDASQSAEEPHMIQKLCDQLRQRGASYVLLERLASGPQASYRARCDVASSGGGVKCCFEATRNTAVDALQDVLRAVLQQASSTP